MAYFEEFRDEGHDASVPRKAPARREVLLPAPFADLNDCAEDWAISDDTERAEALENASPERLRALVKRVAPRLPSINDYLDTHSDETDTDLGVLAEAVCEAQNALHRTNQKTTSDS